MSILWKSNLRFSFVYNIYIYPVLSSVGNSLVSSPTTTVKITSAYKYRSIFVRVMTMREKQILARAIEIQKENWG